MSRLKINVSQHVAEMERLLQVYESPARCEEVIAILRCWQDDEILDDVSRERAKILVREFRSRQRLRADHRAANEPISTPISSDASISGDRRP